jgi:hypothetical protein
MATPLRLSNVRFKLPLAKWVESLDSARGNGDGDHIVDHSQEFDGEGALDVERHIDGNCEDMPLDAYADHDTAELDSIHSDNGLESLALDLEGMDHDVYLEGGSGATSDTVDVLNEQPTIRVLWPPLTNEPRTRSRKPPNPFVRKPLEPRPAATLNIRNRQPMQKVRQPTQRNHNKKRGRIDKTTSRVPSAKSRPQTNQPLRKGKERISPGSKGRQLSSSMNIDVGKYVRVRLLGTSASRTAMCRISHIRSLPSAISVKSEAKLTASKTGPSPVVTVQWLYLRRDMAATVDLTLRSLLKKLRPHEAILTNHTDVVPVESIVREVRSVIEGKKDNDDDRLGWEQFRIVGFWKFDNQQLLAGRKVEGLKDLENG